MSDTMSAYEAIVALTGNRDSAFYSAQAAIIARGRAGMLKATCSRMIETDRYSGRAPKVTDDTVVPEWAWAALDNGNRSRKNWLSGIFQARHGWIHVEMFDVRFDRTAIEKIVAATAPPLTVEKTAPTPPLRREAPARPPHRPEKETDSLHIYLRRLRDGVTCPKKSDEARSITDAWTKADGPTPDTVADVYLKRFYGLGQWNGGKLMNAATVIAAVEAYLADKASDKAE